jgi:hypothetical protein
MGPETTRYEEDDGTMEQLRRSHYGIGSCAVFCLAMLLYSAPVHGQNGNKRCYTVEETFYKVHNLKVTPEIKPIKHCYSDKDHPYRYSVVDIPVSLAAGTVRTPEFSPPSRWYWIMVQVEKPLPTRQMQCTTGTTAGPLDSKNCTNDDPLLRADWIVLEDGQAVKSGSSTTKADASFTTDNISKFIGSFPALAGKKYVVEVKFTKDGTPLNVANPHLIITKIGDE